MRISIIAAVSRNRVIGREGGLPWHLPADLKYFREKTRGHPVIMGRRTYESVGRPLPGRRNIVLSRSPDFRPPGVEVVDSLEKALDLVRGADEVFLLGGERVFQAGLEIADRLYLTEIDAEFSGDTFFPEFDRDKWIVTESREHPADAANPFPMRFVVYERKRRGKVETGERR
ncbi:MAG: type 3 dihydrofolate reductase [Acidobacteriota bacterium]